MRIDLRRLLTLNLLLTLLGLSVIAKAADTESTDGDDPPDRVARLSYLQGDVSLKPAGTEEWALATLNRPLTTDDQLSLDRKGRVELQAGSAVIHLDEGAAFSFSELSDDVLQGRLTDGALHIAVRRLQKGEVIEIDTPHAAITLTKPGNYRIEVLGDGARTLVKTYSGECEVAGNRDTVQLGAREQITLAGDEAIADKSFSPRDSFDSWAEDRNERYARSSSSRYVSPDVIGYEDLDGYGDWADEATYGHVWYPRITVGWSPYRDGHWVWVSPWGWTWVDNAPWGFAPFHYGRWAHVRGRWGWVPGPIRVRAVYAPALVAWVGGPHLGMSVSFGSNIGWFPLAPREVYVPGYHCSRRHIHNVNYSNTVIVNNTIINRAYVNRGTRINYRHRDDRDAITVVSRDTFVNARHVANHVVREANMRDWRTQNSAPAIAPDRASALGPRWNANESRSPERVDRRVNREVIARHSAPTQRASFEQEQRAIRDNDNRPIPRRELWSGARVDAATKPALVRENNATTANEAERNSNRDRYRNDHPRRGLERAQEESRPSAPTQPSAATQINREPREPGTRGGRNEVETRQQPAPAAETPRVERENRFETRRETFRSKPGTVETPPSEPSRDLWRNETRQRESTQRESNRRENVERQREEAPRRVEQQQPAPQPVQRERVEAPRRFEPPPQQQQQEPAPQPRYEAPQRQEPARQERSSDEGRSSREERRSIDRSDRR